MDVILTRGIFNLKQLLVISLEWFDEIKLFLREAQLSFLSGGIMVNGGEEIVEECFFVVFVILEVVFS
jgi:3-deoxy-D-manno-octulosonic-acid transferase